MKYVTLKEFAQMSGLSVQEVKELAIENRAIRTVNKGSKANIYVNSEIMEDVIESEIIEGLKNINNVQEEELCI